MRPPPGVWTSSPNRKLSDSVVQGLLQTLHRVGRSVINPVLALFSLEDGGGVPISNQGLVSLVTRPLPEAIQGPTKSHLKT